MTTTTQTNSIQELRKFINEFRPVAFNIDDTNWNQRQNFYYVDEEHFKPCSISAHLDNYFETHIVGIYDDDNEPNYRSQGSEYILRKKLKVTYNQLKLLFYCAGSPEEPFASHESWERHIVDVLDRMMFIETEPPIKKGWFNRKEYNKNVNEWLEKERTNIEIGMFSRKQKLEEMYKL